jgi:hypothetical protein
MERIGPGTAAPKTKGPPHEATGQSNREVAGRLAAPAIDQVRSDDDQATSRRG